jgi:hypothetical protein
MSFFNKNKNQDKSIVFSNEKSTFWILVIVGAIFILVTLPAVIAIPKELAQGNNAILVVLLFPLTGLGICYGGWVMRQRFLFFGPTPLKLSPEIGQAGGQVGGTISLAQPWAKRKLVMRLSCIHTYTTGSGDNSSTTNSILWQEETQPHDSTGGAGSLLKFCFDVPADQPITGAPRRKGHVHWELMVEGLVSYRTFKRHWKIPVEQGSKQSVINIPSAHTEKVKKIVIEQAEASIAKQIDTELTDEGMNIVSDQGRNKSMANFASLFGLLFASVGCFLFYLAYQGEMMLWLMAPFFFGIGSLIMGFGIFLKGRKLECKLIDQTVHTRRSFFGRILYTRQGPLNSTKQLTMKVMMASQQGSVKTEYMAIYALVDCADGVSRKIKLVEGIEGRKAGEAMMRKLTAVVERIGVLEEDQVNVG